MKSIKDYVYDETQKLGQGSYGSVYLGMHINSKEKVAVKVVSLERIPESHREKILQNFRNEITNMQLAEGENIVKLLGIQISQRNLYLVCEYCNQGNLDAYIRRKKWLTEQETLKFFAQLLAGFRVLHSNNIVHRDLKPGNIMIHNATLKVGDFGFSKLVAGHDQLLQSLVGTPQYMSPQILNKQKYTQKTDIWSLGTIVYQMLYGTVPWHGKKDFDLITKIKKQPLRFPSLPKVSQHTKELISRMLKETQQQRISWEELFQAKIQMPITKQQVRNKLNSIMTDQYQLYQKLRQYAYFYFDLNRVVASSAECVKNHERNAQLLASYNIKIEVSQIGNENSNIVEDFRKKCEEVTNRPFIEYAASKILSKRNKAAYLVLLYLKLQDCRSDPRAQSHSLLFLLTQFLVLKVAFRSLYRCMKILKGEISHPKIQESHWKRFIQSPEKQYVTQQIRYDDTICSLLFKACLPLVAKNIERSIRLPLLDQVIPYVNEKFDTNKKALKNIMMRFVSLLKSVLAQKTEWEEGKRLMARMDKILVKSQLKLGVDLYKVYSELEGASLFKNNLPSVTKQQ